MTAMRRLNRTRITLLLLALLLAAQPCALGETEMVPAPDDETLMAALPGIWTFTDEETELAVLTFGMGGEVTLRCCGMDGAYAYTCAGTWSFEAVQDRPDRLTLRFTQTDTPKLAEETFSLDCSYSAYAESWIENDTLVTYLILEEENSSGSSPFTELYGSGDVAFHREQGPNMRIVNCKNYVSLRRTRSRSAARLAKVPLGAAVLAFPADGQENGFIYCVYQGQHGYILAEYLQPME